MRKGHHHHRDGAVLDWLGLGLSGLCAIHCLILPFVIGLLPFLNLGISDHAFHYILAGVIVPLGGIAFWRGYQSHKRQDILWLGISGIILVILGLVVQPSHVHEAAIGPLNFGVPLTVLGSFSLISAHYRNWRHSRCTKCGSVEP